MITTNGWPRREWQQPEPHGLNFDVPPPSIDNVDESTERATLRDAVKLPGLITGQVGVADLLKVAGQHWDVEGYTDGDAEWLTPLDINAAAGSSTG